jgi:hypothetical protein
MLSKFGMVLQVFIIGLGRGTEVGLRGQDNKFRAIQAKDVRAPYPADRNTSSDLHRGAGFMIRALYFTMNGEHLTALEPSRAALSLKKRRSFPPATHEVTEAP